MSLPPLEQGNIYIRRKSTGQVLIIPEHLFKEEFHEHYDPSKPQVIKKPQEAGVPSKIPENILVSTDQKRLLYTREQLIGLSAKQIKNLPELHKLKDMFFKSKDELLDAAMKIQQGEEVTEEAKPDNSSGA